LFEIERLLCELGIVFDTGCGGYGRDWYFDWSLEGAEVLLSSSQPWHERWKEIKERERLKEETE